MGDILPQVSNHKSHFSWSVERTYNLHFSILKLYTPCNLVVTHFFYSN